MIEAYREFNLPLGVHSGLPESICVSGAFCAPESASGARGRRGVHQIMAMLYENLAGKIRGPPLSKAFNIRRGAKQRNPTSQEVFNAVLEDVFTIDYLGTS